MNANERCISCLMKKQISRVKNKTDENKKNQFLEEVDKILNSTACCESAPLLNMRIDTIYKKYFGDKDEFFDIKIKYNNFLLEKEEQIKNLILDSPDPVKESIKYVCAANYIDFSAVSNVNEKTFMSLIEKAKTQEIDDTEYSFFKSDLKNAKSLVYLTDNCGEVVIDKIFIEVLKQTYKDLDITVILRGQYTLNDATLYDAEQIGLTKITRCIGNGTAIPGTVLNLLGEEAKSAVTSADMIIAKGQGNFESLFREGLDPYYLFLCKCDLFTERFSLEKFSSVFKKESRIGNLKI